MQQTPEFKNGLTAGIVLAVAQMIRDGFTATARNIIDAAAIKPEEDLSFCSDYDLEALRDEWPEFADVYGYDYEPEEAEIPESLWVRNDDQTIDCTLLISDHHFNGPVTRERVAKWSDAECKAVEEYCIAVHINASDNDDYPVPPKPAVLEAA
ncbi:hypothetical protein [Methylophilus sp. YYY-1]|uniref:hypothetical protein n=1 Tax=Methylophilus sp. YYY-1 TaxID=2682087 RepID=UPI0023B289FD|nr:hypothetical protein [Methylophilus sp. YYY-1]MDF0377668.1 hypothetical protein [Methylophilus sp. YYY-1]